MDWKSVHRATVQAASTQSRSERRARTLSVLTGIARRRRTVATDGQNGRTSIHAGPQVDQRLIESADPDQTETWIFEIDDQA